VWRRRVILSTMGRNNDRSTPMTATPASTAIVKIDQGRVNERILAREVKTDFRRVEGASVKVVARFTSAEGKRLFVRLFNTLQLNAHFISVIARTRLDAESVAEVEQALRDMVDRSAETLNQALDGAEALFKAHGIEGAATYDTQALEIEVGILSSIGRRYLEVLGKLDQLMPLLQTLEIHDVITSQAVDIQRAGQKRQVRDVANAARRLATDLRKRMDAAAAAQASSASGRRGERTTLSLDEQGALDLEPARDAEGGSPEGVEAMKEDELGPVESEGASSDIGGERPGGAPAPSGTTVHEEAAAD
jgi:hypothetical protein